MVRVDLFTRWPAALAGVLILGCLAWLAGSLQPREPDDVAGPRETGVAGAEVDDESASSARPSDEVARRTSSDERPAGSVAPDRRSPRKGTERAAFERLLALAATDRAAFDAALDEILDDGDAPEYERVAALRAAWSCDGDEAFKRFRRVIEKDGEKTARFTDFAVRFIGRYARRNAAVRQFLEDEVMRRDLRSTLRASATRSLFRWADGDERVRLEGRLRDERDRAVLGAALAGLGEHRSEYARQAAAELARSHSDPTVRVWAARRFERIDESDEIDETDER